MTDRRHFLHTAAATSAGLLLAPHVQGMPSPKASRKGHSKRMSLTFFPYELKMRHVFTVASYSRSTTPDIQVELSYDGLTGYGEACMPPYLARELGTVDSVMQFLARVATRIGDFSDPFQMEEILDEIDRMDDGNAAGKAAVDIALHDLVGKLMGQPWYRIWGLNPAKAPDTTFTIGIDTPEVVREKTRECAARFNILKVKVGLDSDRDMIQAIRSVTTLPLAVDANQGWKDRQQAIDMIHWLHEQGVVIVEQPMPKTQLDDIAWLTERSPVPIFADESVQRLSDIARLQGAFSGINIKLMKCTGMREAWKMVQATRALGMKVMLGCMTETSCGISAAAQLSPAVDFADLDGNLLIANDRFRGVEVVKGRLTLPAGAGIGVTPVS